MDMKGLLMKLSLFLYLVSILSLLSCKDVFQYNPNEVRLDESQRNLNAKNIQKINALSPVDTVKFILIGDSQRFYDELDDFVAVANKLKGVAFVLLAGDISDFGLNREYEWIHRSLAKLQMPYIGVIGNHDMLANGRIVYKQMFGAENFSFSYSDNQFICLNTNSLETGFDGSLPDLPWLQQQLSGVSKYKNAFIISHIPPFSDGFDKKLEHSFSSLLAAHNEVKLSLHGHHHRFSISKPYNNGPEYVVVGSLNKRNYALFSVWGEQYKIDEVYY
jgi:Icc-related predicted phosphoesterase